jgi:hypothetical protein
MRMKNPAERAGFLFNVRFQSRDQWVSTLIR